MIRPVLLVLLASAAPAAAADFDPRSTEWNGLSELAGLAPLERHPSTGLPTAASGVIWLRPAGADADALRRYVSAGGRALVADDFGPSGPLFEAFGLALQDVDTAALERLGGNPALPVAVGAGNLRVVANHPAGLSGPGQVLLKFAGGDAALAIEQTIGAGKVVFLSDPSLLINNMLELDGNRRFARDLLAWLTSGGRPIRLHVGALDEPASTFWREEVSGLRDHLPWLLLVAFGVAIIALAFLVPAGEERAWGGRDPGAPPVRPVRVAVRAAALAALPDHADGRVLASLVGRRARALLRAEGLTAADAYERLADRASSLPRGLSGLAALLQQVQETPPTHDPYAPSDRGWTVAEALALDEGVQELMESIKGSDRRAA